MRAGIPGRGSDREDTPDDDGRGDDARPPRSERAGPRDQVSQGQGAETVIIGYFETVGGMVKGSPRTRDLSLY